MVSSFLIHYDDDMDDNRKSSSGSKASRWIAVALWVIVILSFLIYKTQNQLTSLDVLGLMYSWLRGSSLGAVLYIVVYALRPFILFPAMWLTILSGAVFGFWGGALYTIVGENISANLAYAMGRFLGGSSTSEKSPRSLIPANWLDRLNRNAFMSILIMRLVYLPFDVVNFGAGILKVKWAPYFTATLIGILPGLITFVSIGASLDFEKFLADPDSANLGGLIKPQQAMLSLALFVISLLIARWLKKRNDLAEASES